MVNKSLFCEDLYAALGVSPDATKSQLKKAFRGLARKYHPDSSDKARSNEMFSRVVEIYEILSDEDLRLEYDRYRRQDPSQTVFREKKRSSSFNDYDGETGNRGADLLRNLREQFSSESAGGSLFNRLRPAHAKAERDYLDENKNKKPQSFWSRLLGDKKKETPRPRKPTRTMKQADFGAASSSKESKTHFFSIDALESLKGCSRELAIKSEEGTDVERKLRVTVPPFVADGTVLNLKLTDENKKSKIIRVKIKIRDHELVSRSGNNITITVPITLGEAIKGGEIDVPGIDSPIKVKLHPLTFQKKRFRIQGRGIKDKNGNTGDLYVIPQIVAPTTLSEVLRHAATAIDQQYLTPVRAKLPTKLV